MQEVGRLSKDEVMNLNVGINFLQRNDLNIVVYKKSDTNILVCKNECKHNGGRFLRDIEDISNSHVKCSRHGWILDCSTMEYTNPPDCFTQEQFTVRNSEDSGDFIIENEVIGIPWDDGCQRIISISPNEFTVTYISHACIEIKGGDATLCTDPWLTGPAFGRGWWLLHEPPPDAWDRLISADAIFISHSHPDHCNLPTLLKLFELNPHLHIYVANLEIPIFRGELLNIGFQNIHVVDTKKWINLTESLRFMILPDSLNPQLDTCLLVDYKGIKVLNLVDCSFPNKGNLPVDVDVLLSDFASGASGFPSGFVEQFGERETLKRAKTKATMFLKKVVRHVHATNAKTWIPFAGYFIEAHPSDEATSKLNWKNSPLLASETVRSQVHGVDVWLPYPGGIFDVGTLTGTAPPLPMHEYSKKSWDFDPFINTLSLSMDFKALQNLSGIELYFKWSNFANYGLQLHVVETNDDFEGVIRSYFVDFTGTIATLSDNRLTCIPYLRIRVRASVLRDVMIYGRSWDNIYTGFSGRYYADPDIYHFKFWNHFTNQLPEKAPSFEDTA